MINFKILILFALFFFTSCNSNDEKVNSVYIDKELKFKIDSYIENAVDNFSEDLEGTGGFFMWKNYRDYLGLGESGFKERINTSWENAYDNETLEIFINSELTKKKKISNLKIGNGLTEIENYNYMLLFPFLAFALEEFILWLILFLIVNFLIIPYVAKITLRKKYKTKNFLSSLALNFLSDFDRQNRIKIRVKKIRKVFNWILIIGLFIVTVFYFNFNEMLNEKLKINIKKEIFENINIKINQSK